MTRPPRWLFKSCLFYEEEGTRKAFKIVHIKLRHYYKCSHWQKMLKSRRCNDYRGRFNGGMIILHLTLSTALRNKMWLINQWRRKKCQIKKKSCIANTDPCCWSCWRLAFNQTLVYTHTHTHVCGVLSLRCDAPPWIGILAQQRDFKIVPLCGTALINDMMMMNPSVTTAQWIKWSHTPLPVITPLDHGSWLQERKHQTLC